MVLSELASVHGFLCPFCVFILNLYSEIYGCCQDLSNSSLFSCFQKLVCFVYHLYHLFSFSYGMKICLTVTCGRGLGGVGTGREGGERCTAGGVIKGRK